MSATIPTPDMTMSEAEALVLEAAMELCRETTFTRVRVLDVLREAIKPWSQPQPAQDLWLAFEAAVTALDYANDASRYCDACKGKGERLVTVKACCKGPEVACGCHGVDGEELAECPDCRGRAYVGRR